MARDAWVKANIRTSRIGQVGVTKTTKGAFFGYLNQIRLQAFGISTTSIASPAALLNYPWSLTDRDFQFCMLYIKTGNVPDPEKFEKSFLSGNAAIARQVVQDKLVEKMKEYLEKYLMAIGGTGVRLVFKIKNAAGVGLALDIAKGALMEYLTNLQKQDVISRYNIDEARRLHLAVKGQSAYRQIASLP